MLGCARGRPRQPVEHPSTPGGAPALGLEAAREEVAAAARRAPAGDRLHERRHRGQQPGARRRRAGARHAVHLAVPATEHASVLAPARALAAGGHRLTVLPVDADGRSDPAAVTAAAPDLLSVALVERARPASCSRSRRSARRCARAAVSSTSTPRRRRRTSPLDVDALGADLLTPLEPQARRAARRRRALRAARHARWRRCTTAGRRSTASAPAPRTCRRSSVSRPRSRSPPRSARRERARARALTAPLRGGIAAAGRARAARLGADVAAAPHIVTSRCPAWSARTLVAALDLEGVAVVDRLGLRGRRRRAVARAPGAWARSATDAAARSRSASAGPAPPPTSTASWRRSARVRGARSRGATPTEAAWPAHGS